LRQGKESQDPIRRRDAFDKESEGKNQSLGERRGQVLERSDFRKEGRIAKGSKFKGGGLGKDRWLTSILAEEYNGHQLLFQVVPRSNGVRSLTKERCAEKGHPILSVKRSIPTEKMLRSIRRHF